MPASEGAGRDRDRRSLAMGSQEKIQVGERTREVRELDHQILGGPKRAIAVHVGIDVGVRTVGQVCHIVLGAAELEKVGDVAR